MHHQRKICQKQFDMQATQGQVEDLWTSYLTFAKFQDWSRGQFGLFKKEMTEEEATHNET